MILDDRRSSFSWQAQYFRQMGWRNRKAHWYEAASSALSLPFLKEVSLNCFAFDVTKFKIEEVSRNFIVLELRTSIFGGGIAELRRFGHVNSHF